MLGETHGGYAHASAPHQHAHHVASPKPHHDPHDHATLQSPTADYTFLETIGEGFFGKVKLAVHNATKEYLAVKIVLKRIAPADKLNREILIHRSVKHENIIRLFESFEDKNHFYLALEFAAGGELFDKIAPDVGVPEELAHFYFVQLLAGVDYLHKSGIVHRDLKPENLLLDAEGNLKITDFGLSTVFIYQGGRRQLSTACGTPPYSAPEIVLLNYDERVDIWSCGIILYVLLVGNTPWEEPTNRSEEFRRYCMSSDLNYMPWRRIPPHIKKLLRCVLCVNPMHRFSIEQIRHDPWFNSANPILANGRCSDPIALATRLMSGLTIVEETVGASPEEASRISDISTNYALSQPLAYDRGEELSRGPDMMECFSQPSLDAILPGTQQTPGTSMSQRKRQFLDLVPSSRLTRFYSRHPATMVLDRLCFVMEDFLIPNKVSREVGAISFNTVDKRKCPLVGEIRVQQIQANPMHAQQHASSALSMAAPAPGRHANANLVLVNFRKGKGDPLEFKRLFRAIRDAVGEMVTNERGLMTG